MQSDRQRDSMQPDGQRNITQLGRVDTLLYVVEEAQDVFINMNGIKNIVLEVF